MVCWERRAPGNGVLLGTMCSWERCASGNDIFLGTMYSWERCAFWECVNSSQKTTAPGGWPRAGGQDVMSRAQVGILALPAAQYVPYIYSPHPPRDHCIVALFDCFLEESVLIIMSSTILEATATWPGSRKASWGFPKSYTAKFRPCIMAK